MVGVKYGLKYSELLYTNINTKHYLYLRPEQYHDAS